MTATRDKFQVCSRLLPIETIRVSVLISKILSGPKMLKRDQNGQSKCF